MAFPTDDILTGAPSYGIRGMDGDCDGIIFHTTEGADASRASAVATATWQATPGKTTGSYNFIIYDGGVLLTVPYKEASGGVNPGSLAWAPERYPFLKEQLPPRAYANPNEYQMNIAFSGKTSVFRTGNIPDNMIDTAARLVLWVQEQEWGSDSLVISGHMHYQTNRSDPSEYVLNRIRDRVLELSMGDNPFSDIDKSFAKNDIIATAEFGLWATKPGTQIAFRPKDTLTREEAAALFARLLRKMGEL